MDGTIFVVLVALLLWTWFLGRVWAIIEAFRRGIGLGFGVALIPFFEIYFAVRRYKEEDRWLMILLNVGPTAVRLALALLDLALSLVGTSIVHLTETQSDFHSRLNLISWLFWLPLCLGAIVTGVLVRIAQPHATSGKAND
jgi:hypothetical protein